MPYKEHEGYLSETYTKVNKHNRNDVNMKAVEVKYIKVNTYDSSDDVDNNIAS